MASSSFTSNSEFESIERVPKGRVPAAAIAFFIAVICIELVVSTHRAWFADLAAWQWEVKRTLIADGTLDGDIAVFGTSVLFHALDPTVANRALGGDTRVVNLALNGMLLQHETQLLRERLASPKPPSVIVLELRNAVVERESWIRGPYFRFWASWNDFLESRFYYTNPSLALSFAEYRMLPSFRYREALDNWIFDSLRSHDVSRHTRDRNHATAAEMRDHIGMVRADFDDRTVVPPAEGTKLREWSTDAAGERWLAALLDTAAAHNVQVVLVLPPAPPYFVERPGPDGFRARFFAEVSRLERSYPTLGIRVFEPTGYDLEDFADNVHFNTRGRQKLSAQFAKWITEYQATRGEHAAARQPGAVPALQSR